MRQNLAIGMLAHVDAGKTTLTEAMLYEGGSLSRLGRVDHQDAFLDTDAMERKRGITIFAKQAVLPLDKITLTLLDTPGHVDFSAEMERTLQVLDYAVLVISGSDGVQGHTLTLWQLLERYRIPTFLFVNKMDLDGTDQEQLMAELKGRLGEGCVRFSDREEDEAFHEEIAFCDEDALSRFLERGTLDDDTAAALIEARKLFPCYFGAALRLTGVDTLLRGLERYTRIPDYPGEFGAKVFKISRDSQNNRLTHLKITGGTLAVKAPLTNRGPDVPENQAWTEKVNQIRLYSGEKFQAVDEVLPGTICAVTGLSQTVPGQGLGGSAASLPPVLEPVLSYRVILPDGCDPLVALRQLRQMEEEDPQLSLSWTEQTQEIHLSLMGEVQLEVLSQRIQERFGLEIAFDAGRILYRETIAGPVVGMGHFEPLRHYAEVHLLLEPGERGSGLRFASSCSEDTLARNWQRLILTHLEEREHPGVLTGAPVTDMTITLLTGRAHLKHTEGGDFRQATYRAVRHGLMQAESVLLEPWYRFRLEVPSDAVGRAMTDLQRVSDDVSLPESDGARAVLTGAAPVAALRDYAAEVAAYTRGLGRLSCSLTGFAPCHNRDAVIAASGYDAERDVENPADSVFCSHGAGFVVNWREAKSHMHLDSGYRLPRKEQPVESVQTNAILTGYRDIFQMDKELRGIYERTYGPIKDRDVLPRQRAAKETLTPAIHHRADMEGPDYLLVDGYNIIHAWEDLREVSRQSMDAARQLLLDLLSGYRAFREREVIVVFDAYRVLGGERAVERYHNISVVYTKEAETADSYIEKATYEIGKKHRVEVATSDGSVQLIILGHGALRITPDSLREELERTGDELRAYLERQKPPKFTPRVME